MFIIFVICECNLNENVEFSYLNALTAFKKKKKKMNRVAFLEWDSFSLVKRHKLGDIQEIGA